MLSPSDAFGIVQKVIAEQFPDREKEDWIPNTYVDNRHFLDRLNPRLTENNETTYTVVNFPGDQTSGHLIVVGIEYPSRSRSSTKDPHIVLQCETEDGYIHLRVLLNLYWETPPDIISPEDEEEQKILAESVKNRNLEEITRSILEKIHKKEAAEN